MLPVHTPLQLSPHEQGRKSSKDGGTDQGWQYAVASCGVGSKRWCASEQVSLPENSIPARRITGAEAATPTLFPPLILVACLGAAASKTGGETYTTYFRAPRDVVRALRQLMVVQIQLNRLAFV
ncbi:hypothetical protein NLG97_g5094 [Lecanicillium saksenae]|uniref:Uncharacterized protein n=1 Tax=Lecanicillium saksenae TaxID=468837 RepID=A0ACC1QWL6_9HYPO|nr:hypothetical protein NLG97_g5094 [Lecanicillium saksenae]